MGVSTGIGLLAGLAAGFIAIAGARADPPPASITLGDLTFRYQPTSWLIEREGEQLVATCMQEDCRDAVVDISRRDGEDGCTLAAMRAEVERLFPTRERAYGNILRTGRFALVLAEAHDGPTLSSPGFAYGCLAWQGSEYRFAMRPETVGTQSWIGGALHYLVSQATAPAARIERIRLGEADFHVSTEFWTFQQDETGDVLRLTCRMPACHEPGKTAILSAHSPPQACPARSMQQEDLDWTRVRIDTLPADAPGGLDVTVTTTMLGCRNYVPPHVEACAVHGDRSYHLSTPGAYGCRSSIWEIPDSVLLDLLRGARIAE